MLEVDSTLIIHFMENGVDQVHLTFSKYWQSRQMITRGWAVRFKHVYREGNWVTNMLAEFALTLGLGHMSLLTRFSKDLNLPLDDNSEISPFQTVRI